jgi:hypothetical protein
MIPQTFSRLWRIRRVYDLGILAVGCALGFASAGYGQANQTDQGKGDDRKPLTDNSATVQPVVPPTSTGEATIYVYRQGRVNLSGLTSCAFGRYRLMVFIDGNPQDTNNFSNNYVQAEVPAGKATVVSSIALGKCEYGTAWTVGRGGYVLIPTKQMQGTPSLPAIDGEEVLWASLPGCTDFDFLSIWISGKLSDPKEVNTARCEAQLRDLLAVTKADLKSSGPSTEAVRLCGLHHHPANYNLGGYWRQTSGYDFYELQDCDLAIEDALRILTGNLAGPARISIDAEVGKSYYVEWSGNAWHMSIEKQMRLVDAETGAKEIRKIHPAKTSDSLR